MEIRTKTLEDNPSRIVVREYFMPWSWGGLQIQRILLTPFVWLFLRLVLGKKIVFDRAYQTMVIENRILFARRKTQTHFSDVESISFSQRELRVAVGSGGSLYTGVAPISVKDLFLLIHDGTQVRVTTSYKDNIELDNLAKRLGKLMGKPFVISQDEVEENEGAEA